MTQKEQARLRVLNSLLAEHMTMEQAATLMGVSTRHTRRILAAYREEGAAALAHGHRGRRAPNATPESLRSEVLRLARSRYSGTNHTHLSELLREREGIEVGRTTLRRILTSAALKSPRHRRPPPAPCSPAADAPRGHADTGGRQPPPVAWRPWSSLRAAAGRGRRHGHRGQRPVLRAGEHPRLLPADEGPDTAPRHTHRALHRPALRLQERARVGARRCTHTVQSCYGRARHTDGLRPVTAG